MQVLLFFNIIYMLVGKSNVVCFPTKSYVQAKNLTDNFWTNNIPYFKFIALQE